MDMEVRRHTARALAWILEALREHDVPYQAVGGMATGAYGADLRFFSARDGRWERQHIDYASSASVRMFKVNIKVMLKDELIRYKSSLGREVDLTDIGQMISVSWPSAQLRK